MKQDGPDLRSSAAGYGRTPGLHSRSPQGVRFFMATVLAFLALQSCMACASMQHLPVPALRIEDAAGTVLTVLYPEDGRFTLTYVHSIHLTRVDEVYRIRDGRLELQELRYDTYGVGMPSDEGESFRIENGRFILALHRSFPSIDLWVSHVPGHGIVTTGQELLFTDLVPPETRLRLVPIMTSPSPARRLIRL